MTKSSPIDLVKSYEDFHKHDAARILKNKRLTRDEQIGLPQSKKGII